MGLLDKASKSSKQTKTNSQIDTTNVSNSKQQSSTNNSNIDSSITSNLNLKTSGKKATYSFCNNNENVEVSWVSYLLYSKIK
jgi:hypothetical protein